jgi:hypothetical protein
VFLEGLRAGHLLIPFQKYFLKREKRKKKKGKSGGPSLPNGFLTIIVNQNARKSIELFCNIFCERVACALLFLKNTLMVPMDFLSFY